MGDGLKRARAAARATRRPSAAEVERVAKLIHRAYILHASKQPGKFAGRTSWVSQSEQTKDNYRACARAVIADRETVCV